MATMKVRVHPDSIKRHYTKDELVEWVLKQDATIEEMEDELARYKAAFNTISITHVTLGTWCPYASVDGLCHNEDKQCSECWTELVEPFTDAD